MSVYLDASVLAALFTVDPFSERTDRFFRGLGAVAVVSDFGAVELASAISRHVRMRELTKDEAQQALSAFDLWAARMTSRVETLSLDVRAAEAYLRRLDLTLRTADALNIAIAQRLGAELATFDVRMADSARAIGLSVTAI